MTNDVADNAAHERLEALADELVAVFHDDDPMPASVITMACALWDLEHLPASFCSTDVELGVFDDECGNGRS